MNSKTLGVAALLTLSGALMLGGCSSTTTEADPSAETPAASETTSDGTNDQECAVAEVTGTSKNKDLMALATAQYEALDCAGDLVEQLKTLGNDPSLQKKVDAAGWDLTVGEALGAVTLAIVDVSDLTTCRVTAMDTPAKAKQMDCGDL